jgi:hypothetical protein
MATSRAACGAGARGDGQRAMGWPVGLRDVRAALDPWLKFF